MATDLPWHTFDPDGRCIAWLYDLPDGCLTDFNPWPRSDSASDAAPTDGELLRANFDDRPVVVVAWPDGSTPEAPPVEVSWQIEWATGEVDTGFADRDDAEEFINRVPSASGYTLTRIIWIPGSMVREVQG